MRIAVALTDAVERTRVGAIFAKADHQVERVGEAAGLLRVIRTFKPDVIIADWELPGGSKSGLLKIVRSMRNERRPYYIVAGATNASADITAAINAGADDFIRRPLLKEELLMRASTPERMRAIISGSRLDPSSAVNFAEKFDITKLPSWQFVEQNLTKATAEVIGVELAPAPHPKSREIVHAAELVLSLPAEKLEVTVCIGLVADDGRSLAMSMLGSDSFRDCLDVTKELANTAAGALKRAFVADGPVFTTGLPNQTRLFTNCNEPPLKRWVGKGEGGLMIEFLVIAKSVEPKQVASAQLREGMVISRDVCTSSGMLILAAGTCLTESSVQRMRALIGETMLIEVSEHARVTA